MRKLSKAVQADWLWYPLTTALLTLLKPRYRAQPQYRYSPHSKYSVARPNCCTDSNGFLQPVATLVHFSPAGKKAMRIVVLPGCATAIALLNLPAVAIANSAAEALMPLQPSTFSVETIMSPDAVEADINAEIDAALAPGEDVINLSELPLLQDFVDEEGRIALPLDLPFGVTVTDSFGDQALGIDYHF
ncbi:MAG: hypothetical protein AAFU71_07015 [Cyanobacteria bacterium J06632_22]